MRQRQNPRALSSPFQGLGQCGFFLWKTARSDRLQIPRPMPLRSTFGAPVREVEGVHLGSCGLLQGKEAQPSISGPLRGEVGGLPRQGVKKKAL